MSSATRCCTNHARNEIDNEGRTHTRCALPAKIDLMVYFNRFISSEGRYHAQDEPNGLEDDDFNPKAGEPRLHQSTYDKIRALGQKYCDNDEMEKTRTGAAIGNYLIEPLPVGGEVVGASGANDPALRRYGIVDSTVDIGPYREKGYGPFSEGFRWNHHLYCK